jgi:hypothetical protein
MTPILSELIARANAVSGDVQSTFGPLNARQINWKPSEDQWSIGQCLDHLLTTNRPYFPVIEQVVRGEQKNNLWQSMPFFPGFFGKMLIKYVSPESPRKLKAPPKFQPSASAIDVGITRAFIDAQGKLTELMGATDRFDLEKIVISSPAIGLITYSLLDSYRIIVNHEERHTQQAKRVLASSGFPGA